MIASSVSGEDLLHLVNTPLELFLAESGVTNVSNQMNLYRSQENKVEIINNLLNRILVSGEGSFTYQDRVYITNMLRKLGITDDKLFMTQVSRIKEEIDSRSKLINMYWEHLPDLVRFVKEYQSSEQNIQKSTNRVEQKLHLHENITNRLQTDAVHQIIQNFSEHPDNHIQLTSEEIQHIEQGQTVDMVLLQRMQNADEEEKNPIIYSREYQNEVQSVLESVNSTEPELHLHEDIMNRLQTGAIYQIVRNFAEHQTNHLQISNEEMWLAEQECVADNILLQRLQSIVRTDKVPLVYRHENYYEQNSFAEEEVTKETVTRQMTAAVLLNLIDNLYESRYEKIEAGEANWYRLENSFYRTAENTLQRFRSELHRNEPRTVKQYRQQFSEEQSRFFKQETMLLTELFEEETQEENYYYSQNRGRGHVENKTENLYEVGQAESVQEISRTEGEEGQRAELVTTTWQEETTRLTEENIASLNQKFSEIREQNSESHRRYLEVMQQEQNRGEGLSVSERENQMRRDDSQISGESGDLLLTYRQEEDITSLKQELDRVNERNEENYRRLLEVRQRAGKREKKVSAAERREQMRRESLQALRDPVSLMLTYRQEAQEQAEEEKRLSEEISREALPESTRQIYHIMEQYLQQPEIWQQTGAVTVNNINRLQQDIRQADMTVLEHGQDAEQREQAAREIVQEAERAAGNTVLPAVERQYHTQAQENLSFVHRQTTNAVDEELIEQLMEDRKLTEQKNIVTQQTREINQTVNTHETWQHVQNIEQRNEDVANMVREDVRKQIGAISDQVYSRLEKRLQNEKKRRGL